MSDLSTETINYINSTQGTRTTDEKNNKGKNVIGKEEFLTMLVAQLQTQDPLDPMSNEDFAINLAQFSQLEQLISINEKMGSNNSSSEGLSSMASYLGHEVSFDSQSTTVKGGKAGSISFDLPSNAQAVIAELKDNAGNTVAQFDLGERAAGHNYVDLGSVSGVPNGEYSVSLTAASATGVVTNPAAYSAGIVDGFVPGADPVLLVNGSEIGLDSIKAVRVANA